MRFDHYALYDEITEQLRAWTRKFPGMCRLSSIGKTREGRDIHLLTVTAGGDPAEKPGLLVDGNLHSGEVASSMAVMYILDRWLSAYKRDPEITRMLRENTVYAIPRINADAAEVYLTTPRTLRGSTEPYYPEESGLQPQDLDGDGEIRQMLVRNDAGQWKKCPDHENILLPRKPEETGGTWYTLLPEGLFSGDEAARKELRAARPREDLDPNRQFPFAWKKDYPDPDRPTSGPEPLHDAEVRALYDFVMSRPNIAAHMNFHTYGGLHISPAVFCPDEKTDPDDAKTMLRLGRSMRAATGYRSEGIFPPDAEDIAPGSYTTWAYYERGIMSFVTELWDFHFQADPDRPENWSMFFSESDEQTLREAETAQAWDARVNGGRGFVPFRPFVHPQLGQVELGGWAEKFCRQNPPPHLLEGVCEKAFSAVMVLVRAMPRLRLSPLFIHPAGPDTFELCVMMSETGLLPTGGTENAEKKGLADGLTVTVRGAEAVGDYPRKLAPMHGFAIQVFHVTVQGKPGDEVTVTVSGVRCGRKEARFVLPKADPSDVSGEVRP